MKVSKVKSGKSASSVSRKKVETGHGGEFAEHLKGAVASSGVSASTEASSVNSVDAILAVQETDDPTQQRGKRLGVQYGGDYWTIWKSFVVTCFLAQPIKTSWALSHRKCAPIVVSQTMPS
jgi:hypothetical protein